MISVVSAVDITISPTTSGGLKKAMETAKNGDTILLKNGVYTGKNNVNLIINKNINIKGLNSKAVLDGEGKTQILRITGKKVKVSIENLKFTNGQSYNNSKDNYDSGGGAIRITKGSLTVKNCTFTENQASRSGGAISFVSKNDILTVSSSTFTKNQANVDGGAIYSHEGITTVSTSTFTQNQVNRYGGAIDSYKLIISSSTFTKNQGKEGGAISSYKLTISKSTFTKNQATKNGGAIESRGKGNVNSCTFTSNKAMKKGGAIYLQDEYTNKITNSKFTKNIEGKQYNAINKDKKAKVTTKNVKITPKNGTKVKK